MTVRGRPRHPDVLTPREWVVFEHLREGRTNEEIAQRLGITLDGAKYHVSSILSKLGVSSRIEASRWQPVQAGRLGFRGWSLLLAFGKMAGVAVAASAILGVGALGYGVLINKSGNEAIDYAAASTINVDETLHEKATAAPQESLDTPTATPRPPSGPTKSGQEAALFAVPAPTAGPGVEQPEGNGGALNSRQVSSPPAPTPTPQPTGGRCEDCEATPTPTIVAPTPQCEGCNTTPGPAGDPPDTPEKTIKPTPTPTATPTATPSQPEEHEAEASYASVTPEPTETLKPSETPDVCGGCS
jgi:DNA-binding CsgD family transcriptional regulator